MIEASFDARLDGVDHVVERDRTGILSINGPLELLGDLLDQFNAGSVEFDKPILGRETFASVIFEWIRSRVLHQPSDPSHPSPPSPLRTVRH